MINKKSNHLDVGGFASDKNNLITQLTVDETFFQSFQKEASDILQRINSFHCWKYCEKISQDIILKKELLIKEKLKELGMLELFDNFEKRKFKRILCEKNLNEETWYVDDGSIDGKRIITFKNPEPEFDMKKNTFKLTFEFKYY